MKALVADDEPTNRIMLKRLLLRWGYDVVVADNGRKAWDILNEPDGPRLAVMDWLMPEYDGVEICRMLTQRMDGPYIYTVLVTHRNTSDDLAVALDSGADDFIRKPVDPIELRSRLGVGKRVLNYDARLDASNNLLRQYGREMETLARMATLGMLSAGVAHEVNNPTTFISGNAQTIARFWTDLQPWIRPLGEQLGEDERRTLGFIMEEMPRAIEGIQQGVARVSKLVRGLKDYSRRGSGERDTVAAIDCVRSALNLCSYQLARVKVQVELDESRLGQLSEVYVDAQQLEQVIVNLCVNASDAMVSTGAQSLLIEVSGRMEGIWVVLEVTDHGPGVPDDIISSIWNPFFTTKAAGKGTGLGLAICKRIIEEHGGALDVRNVAQKGACFSIRLPANQRDGSQ